MKTIKDNALLIIFGLLCVLAFSKCKKKESTIYKKPIVEQPAPIGAMEGKYKWYNGDSATVDLVLTTNVINCQYCNPKDMDWYNCNLALAQNNPPYFVVAITGTKIDTISIFKNSKTFKYYKY